MNFFDYIKLNHPELLEKNNKGEYFILGGCHVPHGWEGIVKVALKCISQQAKYNYTSVSSNISNIGVNKFLTWIDNKIIRQLDPIARELRRKNTKFLFVDQCDAIRNNHPKLCKAHKLLSGGIHKLRIKFPLYKRKDYSPIKIQQIKQKLGRLEIYVDTNNPIVEGICSMARCLSKETCEITGQKGTLCKDSTGWFRVLCDEEQEKLKFNKLNESQY